MLIAAFGLSLSGCSDREHAETSGPVAVRVNGQPIMVADFGTKPAFDPSGQLPPVSPSLMKAMVDLELLRQAAVQSQLDQDEKIRARLAGSPQESPKRKILALAYINKQLSSLPAPSDAEVSTYYNSHPAQFAERRQYELQACVIKPPAGTEAKVKGQLDKSKQFDRFVRWLKANKVRHGCVPVSVSSAQADEQLLQKLKNVPVDSSVVEDVKDQMAITFVQAMQNDPLTLDQAESKIVKILRDKKKAAAYDSMIKQLRDKAKIEYVAPYTANGLTVNLATPGKKGQ
jgi:EpsD family peptidyl-prolyl cis-trans isomerase